MVNSNVLRAFIQLYERLKNKSQPATSFLQTMTASAKHAFEKSVGKYTDEDILRWYKLIDEHITKTTAENTVNAWAELAIFFGNEADEMQKTQFTLLKRDSDFASTLHAMRSYLISEINQLEGYAGVIRDKKLIFAAKKAEINEMRIQGRYHAPTDTRATLILELAYLGNTDAINEGLDLKLFTHFQPYMGDGNLPACLHPLHHQRTYTNLFQCLTGVRYEAFIEHIEKNKDVTTLFPNNPAPILPLPSGANEKSPPSAEPKLEAQDSQLKKQPIPQPIPDPSLSAPSSPKNLKRSLSPGSLKVFPPKEPTLPIRPDSQKQSRVKLYEN